jgi:1-acyl-sn-glycerol-3-phosphate acyltransferase
MRVIIARFFFWISGWRLNMNGIPMEALKKTVMIAAPHTSNWDLPYSLGAFWLMRLEVRYFIKDVYTRSPFGWFFKWTGALGVNRKNDRNNLVAHAIDLLKTRESLVLLVPAEGTRKRVEKWRTGFYHIAIGANVPVALGYLDYGKKEAGILEVYPLTGNHEVDMQHIQEAYQNITAKYPELYNPRIY